MSAFSRNPVWFASLHNRKSPSLTVEPRNTHMAAPTAVQPFFRRWGLPPSPNPGAGPHAGPDPRQRASSLDSISARAGLHAAAPPFHVMERIRDQPFKMPGASPITFPSRAGLPLICQRVQSSILDSQGETVRTDSAHISAGNSRRTISAQPHNPAQVFLPTVATRCK